MVTRRTMMIVGGTTIVGTSGSIGSPPDTSGAGEDNPTNGTSVNDEPSGGDESVADDGSTGDETESKSGSETGDDTGRRRGEADAEVHGSETAAEDDSIEYVGDGTVEIVIARSGDEPIETTTEPFEEWATVWCARIASEAMFEYLNDRLESMRGIGVGSRYGTGVTVDHTTMYDRDGEKISEPEIEFDRLVSETPRTASATVEAGEHEHTCELPVYVRQYDGYLD